jgi:RNA polymerase sigma-70 factor (ECF subfamily)
MEFRITGILASDDMNQINRENEGAENGPNEFAQLVNRARGGDRKAVGELIDRWRNYLLLIANKNLEQDLHAKIAPSDIVQQSMLDAQEKIVDFRGTCEAEFQAWVRQILRNNIHSARRTYKTAQNRNMRREIGIDDSQNQAPTLLNRMDSPGTEALKNERANVLNSAMEKLPEHYQQIIRLRNWDELTFVEIAKRLDSNEDSVRKLWSRAILSLQQVINVDHPGFHSGSIHKPN